MTQPAPPSRWTNLGQRLRELLRRGTASGWRTSGVLVPVGFGVLCLVALVAWVNALTAPVSRAGMPTASVSPLPATTAPTPTSTDPAASTPTPTPTTAAPPGLKSSGKFDTAAVDVPAANSSGELRRFGLRAETTARLDADKTARQVAGVLNDPRSWAGSGGIRFALTADPDRADFSITLAAPGTAGKLCRLDAAGSCTKGTDVVIDASLWKAGGAGGDFGSTAEWRAYLVNHALGHLLGERHADCAKRARPAPVMMPQLDDLDGCTPNAWPYP